MNLINGWTIAKAVNGDQIQVRIIPLKRKQNNVGGISWVEVGKQIQLETGQSVILISMDDLSILD